MTTPSSALHAIRKTARYRLDRMLKLLGDIIQTIIQTGTSHLWKRGFLEQSRVTYGGAAYGGTTCKDTNGSVADWCDGCSGLH